MRSRTLAMALAVAALAATAGLDARQPDKKVDPKSKTDPKAAPKVDKADPEPKFNLKVKTGDIRLGAQLMGAKLSAEDLTGRVVIVDFWGVNCAPCLAAMPGTAALNSELGDFGLVVIGSHVQNATPEQIKSVAASRGANFPIMSNARVSGGDDFQGIPHAMVFDHTGACVFRGDPKGAEVAARLAVGEMLVANAQREKLASPVAAIAADLKKGRSPATVLARVAALQNAGSEPTTGDAKALLASLTAQGQKKVELAQAKLDAEPYEAYLLVEKLPTAFKGTPVAKSATDMMTKLRKDKAVSAELAARPGLEAVRQVNSALESKPGADKPGAAEFQKANAMLLGQLRTKVNQMKKSWPDARATKEAADIADRYAAAP